MSGTEGIHHVAVSIAGQSLGELLLAGLHSFLGLVIFGSTLLYTHGLAFLFGIVAQVLQQQGLTHLQSLGSVGSLGAVGSECYGNAQSLLYGLADLTQREFRVHLSFGFAHVRHDDSCTTISQNLLQCGQGTADAGVVCDLTILIKGYVEVYTYDCLLTGKVKFVDCHNCIIL